MQRLNLSSVADTLASRLPAVTASIVDHKMVTKTLAQVIVTVNTKDVTRQDLYRAVAKALDYKARPIEASFRSVDSYGNPAMVGFIELNREVKPYTEAAAKQMVALASNMFMDQADDSLWETRSDASGGKMLARQQDDDLSALLVTAKVSGVRAPKIAEMAASANSAEFVAFIDPVSAIVRHGYVIATDLALQPAPVGGIELDEPGIQVVVAPEFAPEAPAFSGPDNTSDEIREPGNRVAKRLTEEQAPVMVVPCSLVLESAFMNDTDKRAEVAAPVNSRSKEAMADYYRQLYDYAPEYYADVKKIIDSHSAF